MIQNAVNQIIARLRAFTVEEVRGPVLVVFAKQKPIRFNSVHDKDQWAFAAKTGSLNHMRAGHYSIIVLPDDIGICKEYTSLGDNSIQPDSKHWESHKRDRQRQLKMASDTLAHCQHPLRNAVMQDIAIELNDLKRG